jgi:RNA polymerase sigma-70 factor, ECF subfamily
VNVAAAAGSLMVTIIGELARPLFLPMATRRPEARLRLATGARETVRQQKSAEPPEDRVGKQAEDRARVLDLLARRDGAVAAAWRHFVPFVDRVLRRLVGRHRDLEDLRQEVFVRFFRKVDQLREPDAVRAFLYGIAFRVSKRDHRYRWLRRHLSVAVETDVDAAVEPLSDAQTREAAQRLIEHLDALDSEKRSLIVCRYVEEMTLEAVAYAHGLSFNTMRRRLERAWATLERRIAGDDLLACYLADARRRNP